MKTFSTFCFLLSAFALCGCRVIEFSQTQDGKTTSVRMIQAFTRTYAYTCELTPVSARLTAVKSGVDGKALGVAAAAAVKAAITP